MLFNVHSFIVSIICGDISVLNGSIKEGIETSSLPEEVKSEMKNQLSTMVVNRGGLVCSEEALLESK